MPFEKQIKQFLIGVLKCVFICCRKCWIEARKVTAEAGTAVGAFSVEVLAIIIISLTHCNTSRVLKHLLLKILLMIQRESLA